MSVESFFDRNPADYEFAINFAIPEHEKVSPVRFMANILIREGVDELQHIGPMLAEAIKDKNAHMEKELHYPFLANSGGIYLGVSLITIEAMLATGKFDQGAYNKSLQDYHEHTRLSPRLITTFDSDYRLSTDNYNDLIKTAVADKTFASFFDTNFHLLPLGMQDNLSGYMLKPILQYVLPEYIERVSLLIPSYQAGALSRI